MGGGDGQRNAEGRLNHGGRWRSEHEWPLARTRYTPYYLHNEGSLTPEPPGKNEEPDRYDYAPDNPVPTLGGHLHQHAHAGRAADRAARPALPLSPDGADYPALVAVCLASAEVGWFWPRQVTGNQVTAGG